MKNCPSCSRSLADNAHTCPQCGYAFNSATRTAGGAIIWYIVIATAIVILMAIGKGCGG